MASGPLSWPLTRCLTGGRLVGVRRAGRGAPLLYLHDAGADTLASPAFDLLARDRDVAVVHLPGYPPSDPPGPVRSARDVAALLAGVLDSLGWSAAAVAGTSLGGWFAAELALHAPERVRGLLLCDAAGLHVPEEYLLALFAEGRAAASSARLVQAALVARLGPAERDVTRLPAAVAAAELQPFVQDLAAAAAMSWHPHTLNPRLLGRLPAVRCPTVVLWGAQDALIPLSHGRAFAEAIPAAELVIVRDAGHLVALDAPEAFVEAALRL